RIRHQPHVFVLPALRVHREGRLAQGRRSLRLDRRPRLRLLMSEGTLETPELPYGVRLRVAYDGTDLCGYQRQPKVRTVQSELEPALARMGVKHGKLRGASRTDSGVHAEGNLVSFACDRQIPTVGWALRLNTFLPPDVAVRDATHVDPSYDPRFDSLAKTYRYLVYVGVTRDPLRTRRYWFLPPSLARRDCPKTSTDVREWLDLEAMTRAAAHLEGTHDFHAFRAADDPRDVTIRTLFGVRLLPGHGDNPDALAIDVEGNAFMKNMVRILVGTLIDYGRRYRDPDEILGMLEPGRDRSHTGPTAPARGLTLRHIRLGRIAASESR